MNRKQAKKFIKDNYNNMTNKEIAEALAENGYLSQRTGKPLLEHSVYNIAQKAGYTGNKRAASKKTMSTNMKRGSKLSAVRAIAKVKEMPADERLAIIEMLTD